MIVSEKTMQLLIEILDEEIGPTFNILDLERIVSRAREKCEAAGGHEEMLPEIFGKELRDFKQEHKIFNLGRFKYVREQPILCT